MPKLQDHTKRVYMVTQTREVMVEADTMAEAVTMSEEAFANPGQPNEGMKPGVWGLPKISSINIERLS